MTKLSSIIQIIESIAPPALQESYDNSGLLVGRGDMEIRQALLCLDCTEEVIEEAIEKGCNLVIAHHPIVFSGLKRFNGANYVQRAVEKAIKNDIALYACHTNIDNVLHNGVNQKIASKLGLKSGKVLEPKQGVFFKLVTFVPNDHLNAVQNAIYEAGAGQIGNYTDCGFSGTGFGTFTPKEGANPFVGELNQRHTESETRLETIFPGYLRNSVLNALFAAHPYEEVAYDIIAVSQTSNQIGAGWIGEFEDGMPKSDFLSKLKTAFGLSVIKYTGSAKDTIKRVAICGGSGSFLIKLAMAAGADVYITGDVKYHEFFDAENKMMVCDIGHWESEQYTIEIFYEVLKEKMPNFAAIYAQTITNPVKYYF